MTHSQLFIQFLKEEGIFNEYKREVRKNYRSFGKDSKDIDWQHHYVQLHKNYNADIFIASFILQETKSGRDYWNVYRDRYVQYLKKHPIII